MLNLFISGLISIFYQHIILLILKYISILLQSSISLQRNGRSGRPKQTVDKRLAFSLIIYSWWNKVGEACERSYITWLEFVVNNPNCINFKSNILTTFDRPTFNKCLKLLKREKPSSDSKMEQLKSDLILRQLKTIFRGKWFCWNNIAWFMLVTYVEDKITVTVWPCWS